MKTHIFDELSVFFLCYNEEANIQTTFNKALPIVQDIAKNWEIILINDGSKDKTGQVIEQIRAKYPKNVKIVTHEHNRGYGAAFKSGVYNSKYEWITFTDSDGQFDFNDIYTLQKKQQQTNADMVIGYYLGRKVPYTVILGSQLWQFVVYLLFGLKVRDNDCGFKLFRKKIIDTIPKLVAERGPFINSEFLIKSKKSGFKIVEEGVHHFPRTAGQATGRKLSVIIAGFRDLFKLWYKINFQSA